MAQRLLFGARHLSLEIGQIGLKQLTKPLRLVVREIEHHVAIFSSLAGIKRNLAQHPRRMSHRRDRLDRSTGALYRQKLLYAGSS